MSRSSFTNSAFHAVCKNAIQAEVWYVILMESISFYGGPEEGGWWGRDSVVEAYQAFPSEELANAAKAKVEELAAELTNEDRREYGEHCNRQLDWLEARGLEADFLPENDGPSEYYVRVSQEIPEPSYQDRQYS